jgi:uncharacterized DUF497 family protein
MRYEWDSRKSRENNKLHGVGFDIIETFDWAQAIEVLDDRFEYGEERWLAIGPIGARLYAVAFTERGENVIRVISLRPATKNERKAYAEAKR